MQTNLSEQIDRTAALTAVDLEHKSISDLMLSMCEELGEFSREVKIEDGVFGNAHKKADCDGSQGEAIDMIIMSICLYAGRGGSIADIQERMKVKLDKWESNQKREL